MIKIIYSDIAVGSKTAFSPTASEQASISNISQLRQSGLIYDNYTAVCEPYQMLLDGSQRILPDDLYNVPIGYWSNQLSGADGTFSPAITITLTADGLFSAQGVTITFDPAVGVWATQVNIKWYNGGVLLSDMNFTPDSAIYFCSNKVDNYNKIIISFAKINMPNCRLKIQSIDQGIVRVFTRFTDVSVIQEASPISAEVSINTLDFTIIGDDETDYVFQSKQPLELYNNSELLGVFFVDSYERTDELYSVAAEDYKGLLDAVQFVGGVYNNASAYDLLTEIFDTANVPVSIDAAFREATVSGLISICSCREAVRQICFAIGAAVDTARSNTVNIFAPSDDIVHTYPLTEIMQGQSFADFDKKLTDLRLTVHTYTQSNESVEAYSADDSGVGTGIYVTFSEPLYNLSIVSGTIVESGSNYAIINAHAGCVLRGYRYKHTTSIQKLRNPLTNVGDPQYVIEVADMTLVNPSIAASVLTRLWDYYVQCGIITSELVISGQKPIDKIVVSTEYLGEITARIESERYNLHGGTAIVAEVKARKTQN